MSSGMTTGETRELALKLAAAGFHVFPIGLSWNHEKQSIDKVPLNAPGFTSGVYNASSDPETVERMFNTAKLPTRTHPGVGIHPGPSGYIVLDVDIKNGGTGPDDLKRLDSELGELPQASRVDTASGGWHFWLRRPEGGEQIGNADLAPGIEVRCDKGYVVAPGVTSPWGSWEWDSTTPKFADTPVIPEPWAAKLNGRRPDGTKEPIPDRLSVGSRHRALLRVAGAMRRQGADYTEIHAALTAMNEARCDPPKPASDIEEIARDVVGRYPAEPDPDIAVAPPQPVAVQADPTSLEDCVATFREYMHLPDPGSVYVSLATVLANRGEGDPIWTLLVGGPSSGKTEPVLTLRDEPDCHLAGPITEAALLSGTPKRDAKGSKGGLLREIGDFGVLLVKDFTSVLSMYRDTRAALLAALREVYDGTWTRHVGTDGGRTLQWDGKLGLLGCVTGAIDSAHSVMAAMGERFILYRIPESDEAEQSRTALGRGDGRRMRTELTAAMRGVLADAADRPTRGLTEPETAFLVALSQLVARGRSTVDRDGYSREINLVYAPEGPARIALVLKEMLLALDRLGLALDQTQDIVRKLGLDSIPDLRRKVLEQLLEGEGVQTTSTVAVAVDHPTKTTHRTLEDLAAHKLVTRTSQGQGKADLWAASGLTVNLWTQISETETQGTYGKSADTQGDSLSLNSPLPVLVDISVPLPPDDFEGRSS